MTSRTADLVWSSMPALLVGHEEIVWAKLKTMAEGARIASKKLWAN